MTARVSQASAYVETAGLQRPVTSQVFAYVEVASLAQAIRVSQAPAYAEVALAVQMALVTAAGVELETIGIDALVTASYVEVEVEPWPARARVITARLFVDWDRDGNYSEETDYFITAQGTQRLVAPEQSIAGGGGTVDQVRISLHNTGRRFSARNSASPLYSQIRDGSVYQAPMYLQVDVDGDTYRLFTGVVRRIEEQGMSAVDPGIVVLDCRSRDDLLMQDKRSTSLVDWQASLASQYLEDWHIVRLLEAMGMVDGVDFVSQEYAAANSVRPSIDGGLFPISHVWLDDDSPLQALWSLAGACGGWFYCDADGVFRYHNMAGLLDSALAEQFGPQTVIRVGEYNVAGLSLAYRDGELYNELTVEAASRGMGETGVLWEPDDPVVVQPNQTLDVWARLNAPAAAITGVPWSAHTAGGQDITASVALAGEFFAQRVKLTFTNNSGQAAYIDGLQILGRALTTATTVEATRRSSNSFWNNRAGRTRSVRGNAHIQSAIHADTLAGYLLARQEQPQLFADVRDLDRPDVRVGRKVLVEYFDLTSAGAIGGIVIESRWTLNVAGFKQDVSVMETESLFAGCAPFFILGTHELGDTGDKIARLYY